VIRIRRTSHDPLQCLAALQRADVVILDLETSGLTRHDRIVAAGMEVDGEAYVLVTEEHRDLSSVDIRISGQQLSEALAPLATRRDLVAVFHHAAFDVAMLERHGIRVHCVIHDTRKLLKLIDSDRGRERDDGAGTGTTIPRYERRYQQAMNYRLKDLARHLLNMNPLGFPGQPSRLPLNKLTAYLKSDLVITSALYTYLLGRVDVTDRSYNDRLIAPLTPLLVCMSVTGVAADAQFIEEETQRLLELMRSISDQHKQRFGMALDVGDFQLRRWIYFYGLKCRVIRSGAKWQPSLRSEDFQTLYHEATLAAVKESLALIHDYRLVRSLMTRLRALLKHVDPKTHRIHSTFNDSQSSGRVSSTEPNLQQIARIVGPDDFLSEQCGDVLIRSRNALTATPGYRLVAFDIGQADIRVLAHMVESFPNTTEDHIAALQQERLERLPQIAWYREEMWNHFRQENKKETERPPQFDPHLPCRLAEDFRRSAGDFYTVAAERMLGTRPTPQERDHMKRTILGIVNGMSAAGLAKQLGVDRSVASGYLKRFAETYPQTYAYSELTKHTFAITGESRTYAGRPRRVTPHWWMANEPVVELFVSYKGADKLWLEVVPLRPSRFTLTCWVKRVIDARHGSPNEGLEIYHDQAGRISQAPYRFFSDSDLIFRLPVRNIPWRLIRRVRTATEEAVYDGYDRTWRQLFNHVAQGGTADIAKTMMLRSVPICDRFGARLILQIHDELVFEVPVKRAGAFTRAIHQELLRPPADDFHVPIVLTPKTGQKFGELQEIPAIELSGSWLFRLIHTIRQLFTSCWQWLVSRVRARARS
jgi:DNA polymerase I-like protein with 3'-5' exonuclease and polymerase domains